MRACNSYFSPSAKRLKKHSLILLFLLFLATIVTAQVTSNLRIYLIPTSKDTVILDTLSIIPGSLQVRYQDQNLDSTLYSIDVVNAKFIFTNKTRNRNDSITVRYRVFPILFGASHQLRDRTLMEKNSINQKDPFLVEQPGNSQLNIFGMQGLSRSGSISRGITIGNNQDAVVNSSLNLQLAGKLSNDIEILAAITDDNVPIQAEGNTQQLQEFDKVYIQLNNTHHKLIAGDFEVRNPDGYFLRYYKKGQGGLYSFSGLAQPLKSNSGLLNVSIGAAVSKGKFARNTFNGIESNQGPYRLRGAENENFIIILSGSEKIYLDGALLDRGQDRDYIIDYNTAEVTFTTKRIVTKDSRIVVEFQYSDKSYARTILTGSVGWKQKKWRSAINVYSEQDSKNQPLQQNLSNADKLILSNAGDNLSQAFAPNVDSVAFNVNEILYARIDTVVNGINYFPVYFYSTNSDSAKFRVGFTNVGAGKGNYVLENGLANGKVYSWIAPLNNIPQGSYEPKVQLISPKQRQMITASGGYDFNQNTKVGIEVVGTKNDINRFSKLDKDNDKGAAARLTLEHSQPLKKDSVNGWRLTSSLQSEVTDKNFVPIENYRPIEFIRDWNTTLLTVPGNEFITAIQFGISHPIKGDLHYSLRSYLHDTQYQGLMNSLGGQWKKKGLLVKADASLLNTSGTIIKSTFLRHREEVNKRFGNWIPGVHFEQERNETKIPGTDSITPGAFSFRIAEIYLQRPDTSKIPLKISASRRFDDGIKQNKFTEASIADMFSVTTALVKEKQRLSGQINYRNLQITDSTITTARKEESVGGRVDYSLTIWKGALQFNTFYEGGTGREPKKLYSYIAVAQGTGTYSWNDYNADGIPQLNEFEIASFQDQANYIRIFTPTDDYVKVFFNQYNAVINLLPASFFQNSNKYKLLSKFSLQSSVRFDNRIANVKGVEGWNPFPRSIPDTLLLTTQSSSRHTLYYNRSSPSFGADITYQDQQSRQLLSNGIEARSNRTYIGVMRWNITQWVGSQTSVESGIKESRSEAFKARDFEINRYSISEKINLQPGTTYRLSFSFRNEAKNNVIAEGLGEKATVQDGGFEWRYSTVKRGIISAKFNLVNIKYSSDANSSIAYEMLEGLKAGTNLTWGFSIQRNLGNSLQLNITYDGRKPSGLNIIHTGGAQVRAYF